MAGEVRTEVLHIRTYVTCRFAATEMRSKVTNGAAEAKEAEFVALVPKKAFLTFFELEMDGRRIQGRIVDKESRRLEMREQRRADAAAAWIPTSRNCKPFHIAVSIPGRKSVWLRLAYQELLERSGGTYRYLVEFPPSQKGVADFRLDAHILEQRKITMLHVPEPGNGLTQLSNPDISSLIPKAASAKVTRGFSPSGNFSMADVEWSPSLLEQGKVFGRETGQFMVLYDTERSPDAGELLVSDRYFLLFTSGHGLARGRKEVVFLVDVSSSMEEVKLEQVKGALRRIIGHLRQDDYFNLITFGTKVTKWEHQSPLATTEKKADALRFIEAMKTHGGTDMAEAIRLGAALLRKKALVKAEGRPLSFTLFLITDGQPTIGLSHPDEILDLVGADEPFCIYAAVLGRHSDYRLLQQLAARTGGEARRVGDLEECGAQLDWFYTEVAHPLLADWSIRYVLEEGGSRDPVNPEELSVCSSAPLLEGGEQLVAGRLPLSASPSPPVMTATLAGRSATGELELESTSAELNTSELPVELASALLPNSPRTLKEAVERCWAFLRVRNLLKKAAFAERDFYAQQAIRKKALSLSLQYKFCTELTTMVVDQKSSYESGSSENVCDTTMLSPVTDAFIPTSEESPSGLAQLARTESSESGKERVLAEQKSLAAFMEPETELRRREVGGRQKSTASSAGGESETTEKKALVVYFLIFLLLLLVLYLCSRR